MQIGFVGLGKMGGNMVHRIHRDSDNQVVAFDLNDEHVREAEGHGAKGVASLDELVSSLEAPRMVWIMVPAGAPTQSTVDELAAMLQEGDTIIDGGNTKWHDDVARAAALTEQGIRYVDVGTSGGVWGLEVGYCMMVGGHPESVEQLSPILDTLAPPDGWRHFGDAGAGHFVKMIHNGIEYGIMQAYAEGFEVMHKSRFPIELEEVCGALEPRLGRPLVAARAGREGVQGGGQRPREPGRQRLGLRRGPLDARRRDRSRRPDAGDRRRALRALLLAQGGGVHAQGACGAAQPVRRPRGGARRRRGLLGGGLHPHRRPGRAGRREPARRRAGAPAGPADDDGHLRRVGRPGRAQAAAGALQPRPRGRAAGALQPDRRRAPRADRRRVPRGRARVDQEQLAPRARRPGARGTARAHALRVGAVRRHRGLRTPRQGDRGSRRGRRPAAGPHVLPLDRPGVLLRHRRAAQGRRGCTATRTRTSGS